ncbi:MAG TPA: MarR family transcriptional regulator, partial [Myxococcales bacterium]
MASECLAVRVRRLGRVITRVYDAALAPHGVTIAQLNLLTAIVAADGPRPTDLVRILDVEKSTLSRDLQRMEHLGWI